MTDNIINFFERSQEQQTGMDSEPILEFEEDDAVANQLAATAFFTAYLEQMFQDLESAGYDLEQLNEGFHQEIEHGTEAIMTALYHMFEQQGLPQQREPEPGNDE